MNEWTLPAVLVAGIGLGLVFAVAAFGWALWAWFGRDATTMLAEAWRSRLSAALRVAPPPLPPLDPPRDIEPRNIGLWQQDQNQGLRGQDRDEGLS